MDLKIKYKGKEYKNLIEPVSKIMIEGVKNHFKKVLKPFEKEIEQYNGIVTINIPENFKNANIEITNIPDNLRNRIIDSLQ